VNQTHDLQQTKGIRQSLHNTDDVYVDVKWTSRTVQLIHVQFFWVVWPLYVNISGHIFTKD